MHADRKRSLHLRAALPHPPGVPAAGRAQVQQGESPAQLGCGSGSDRCRGQAERCAPSPFGSCQDLFWWTVLCGHLYICPQSPIPSPLLLYHLHRSAMSPASPAQLPCPVGLAETGSGLAHRRQPDPSRELDGISSHAVKTGPLDLKNLPGAPSLPLSWNFLAASPFPSLFLRHYLA